MRRFTVTTLKLYCKQIPTKTIDITAVIPFVQQLSSENLLTLFVIHTLKAEKVLGRKNGMNLFYHCILFQNINCKKFATTALHHSLT